MKAVIICSILCAITIDCTFGIGESKVYQPCKVLGLKFNETVKLPNTCAPYRCNLNGEIELENCGDIATEPPCSAFPANVTLPFPDCCWRIECDEELIEPTPKPREKHCLLQ